MIPLTKPLCWLDTETTGLDPQKDRIITLGVELHADGVVSAREFKFHPGVPITPENAKIHGFTEDLVKFWPLFSAKAKMIHDRLVTCDFAGFNVPFDLQVLSEEFDRCGMPFDIQNSAILDVGLLYKKLRPRRLENAVEEWCGHKHEGAHGAQADAVATREVFEAMIERGDVLGELSLQDIAFCSVSDDRDGSTRLDLAGTVIKRKDGVIVYGTKRNRGVPVMDDIGYAHWILRSDFPANTRRILSQVLEATPQKTFNMKAA